MRMRGLPRHLILWPALACAALALLVITAFGVAWITAPSITDLQARVRTLGIGKIASIFAGRGIAASHRRHVFEPFYRGPGSRGSGLGLAICRGFVEANGGRIQIQTRDGKGTTFVVSFPPTPQPAPLP